MPDIRAMPACLSSSTEQSHFNGKQNVSHAAALRAATRGPVIWLLQRTCWQVQHLPCLQLHL